MTSLGKERLHLDHPKSFDVTEFAVDMPITLQYLQQCHILRVLSLGADPLDTKPLAVEPGPGGV